MGWKLLPFSRAYLWQWQGIHFGCTGYSCKIKKNLIERLHKILIHLLWVKWTEDKKDEETNNCKHILPVDNGFTIKEYYF